MLASDPKILLVDDDALIVRSLARALRTSYPYVFTADRNEVALAVIRSERPQVVISDLNRPGGTGEEFVREVRLARDVLQPAIIILTGNPGASELRLWRAGITEFLTKPVHIPELIAAVDRALGMDRDPDAVLIGLGFETRDIDYKASLDFESRRAIAELARDVLAMANSGGGAIVFGVEEPTPGEFRPVGLHRDDAARYETTRLGDALGRYLDAEVAFACRLVPLKGRVFPVLKVRGISETIALSKSQHEDARLFMGRLYVRTEDAKTIELRDPALLRRIVDDLVRHRLALLMAALRAE